MNRKSTPEINMNKALPALPAKWSLKGDFLTDEEGYQRYIRDSNKRIDRALIAMILGNYGYPDHAKAWMGGTPNPEAIAMVEQVLEAMRDEPSFAEFHTVNGESIQPLARLRAALELLKA